jgi:hypothetical protein
LRLGAEEFFGEKGGDPPQRFLCRIGGRLEGLIIGGGGSLDPNLWECR